jgi:hypothetical protein
VADLNSDGSLDLIVPNQPVGTNGNGVGPVSVFYGKPDGSFLARVNYVPGLDPSMVAAGDFNGDGKPDLAVANRLSLIGGQSLLRILVNTGNGTFVTAHSYYLPVYPTAIVVGDFNGDGHQDLALGSYALPLVAVFLGNGDGSFQPGRASPSGSGTYSLAAGDFNHDGKLDLAVDVPNPLGSSTVNVLLGKGNGTFGAPVPYAVGGGPVQVVAADLNGDGKPDLAVVDQGSGGVGTYLPSGVTVLLNQGNGSFAPGVFYEDQAQGAAMSGTVADINGDGKPDLVVGEFYGIAIFQANGDGTFAAPTHLPFPSFNDIGGQVRSGDFNHDGNPDIAITTGGGVTVFLQAAGAAPPTGGSASPEEALTTAALSRPQFGGQGNGGPSRALPFADSRSEHATGAGSEALLGLWDLSNSTGALPFNHPDETNLPVGSLPTSSEMLAGDDPTGWQPLRLLDSWEA